ncbi:MAG: [FeFe] hydrogenase, group A [Dehalococcoidia bacterium]
MSEIAFSIDGLKIKANEGDTILSVALKHGIYIPHLCHHFDLPPFGGCRLCMIEIEGRGLTISCKTPAEEGLKVITENPEINKIRRIAAELIIADHYTDCLSCVRNTNCRLQDIATHSGIKEEDLQHLKRRTVRNLPMDESSPYFYRDPNKCVLCGNCVRECGEIQNVGALDFAYRGAEIQVMPAFGKPMPETECVGCGQCIQVCPTAAITIKYQTDAVWAALKDPNKRVIVQTAPAVRVALAEEFGGKPGTIITGKMVAALRRLGFDQIYDTTFSADLTVMEETTEFLHRLEKGENIPLFTSCCPAWVNYVEYFHPDLLNQLSTCRSPQQMMGALLKKFYAKQQGLSPQDIFVVSVMPCTAKKSEAQRPEFRTQGIADVDAVISTPELVQMIREKIGFAFNILEDDCYDSPFGFGSGAGVGFGSSGGVSAAVIRTVLYKLSGGKPPLDYAFTPVEGFPNTTEAVLSVGDKTIRIAMVRTLGAANKLIEALRAGEVCYHLVEVMACPAGCISGGGQPLINNIQARQERAQALQGVDQQQRVRTVQDNPFIDEIYRQWLEKPGSHVAHHDLHTTYTPRRTKN